MVLFARLIRHKPNSTAIEDQYHIPDAPCMDYLPPSGENGTQFKGKCREIFPTWSIWVSIDSYANCVLCPHELSANHSDIFRAFHLTPFCAVETLRFVGRIFPFQNPCVGGFTTTTTTSPWEDSTWRKPSMASCGSDLLTLLKNTWFSWVRMDEFGKVWKMRGSMVIFWLQQNITKNTHTHTWWSWVLFLRDDFCEGNVKIRQIRCTSETEAPPTFKAPFLGDEGD